MPESGAPPVNLPGYNPKTFHADGRTPLPHKNMVVILSGLALLFAALYSIDKLRPQILYYKSSNVVIDDRVTIKSQVADDERKRVKGLSNRETLAKGEGMLFTFSDAPDSLYPVFWMKDMNFPLDIIWITKGEIVYLDRNVQPAEKGLADNKIPVYMPPVPVDMVLEVNAGFAEENGLQAGMKVTLQ